MKATIGEPHNYGPSEEERVELAAASATRAVDAAVERTPFPLLKIADPYSGSLATIAKQTDTAVEIAGSPT